MQLAFKARRNLISQTGSMCAYNCLKQSERAGELLRESLNVAADKHSHHIVQVHYSLEYKSHSPVMSDLSVSDCVAESIFKSFKGGI